MSDKTEYLPRTGLRCSYERTRTMPLGDQLRECADQLGNPEVLCQEIVAAYRALEGCGEIGASPGSFDPNAESGTLMLEHFYEDQRISVPGEDGFEFQCVATNFVPVPGQCPSAHGERDGLDYIGVRSEHFASPIFGGMQSADDATSYAVLMRLFACLGELLAPVCLERLTDGCLKGILSPVPLFDLHLVVWPEPEPTSDQSALLELTRDLAENIKDGLDDSAELPGGLGEIYCLRMDPSQFDGKLELVWRV